eukprot:Selendium_serpulae@DN5472_c5_g1_i1.p2
MTKSDLKNPDLINPECSDKNYQMFAVIKGSETEAPHYHLKRKKDKIDMPVSLVEGKDISSSSGKTGFEELDSSEKKTINQYTEENRERLLKEYKDMNKKG